VVTRDFCRTLADTPLKAPGIIRQWEHALFRGLEYKGSVFANFVDVPIAKLNRLKILCSLRAVAREQDVCKQQGRPKQLINKPVKFRLPAICVPYGNSDLFSSSAAGIGSG
jgi:hypothetical protein